MPTPSPFSDPGAKPSSRLHNFAAGPAVLPLSVLEEVKAELPVYRNAGASIMEISHRSPEYSEVADQAQAHLRRLLGIGEDWHILFLQGGASLQFYQVPLNFLPAEGTADYLITGSWAKKALKEAKRVGATHVVASSEERNFSAIPEQTEWRFSANPVYVHFTSNNTIFGTQLRTEPDAPAPLVCDASSDFLSHPVSMSRYGLIYAGAQKNLGPAGVTLVLVQDSFLQKRKGDLPTMLDYGTHINTLYNTPPVFAVYILEKVLRWVEGLGGLAAMQERNESKAARLYTALDGTDFYRGTADTGSRSLMNVCFRLADESLEGTFLSEAKAEGLVALKGHRSVGGIRASIYNACPEESVDALVAFMKRFEQKHG